MKRIITAIAFALAFIALANPASAKPLNKDILACDKATVAANTVDGKPMTLDSARHLRVGYLLTIPGAEPDKFESGENAWEACADPDRLNAFLAWQKSQSAASATTTLTTATSAASAEASPTVADLQNQLAGKQSDILRLADLISDQADFIHTHEAYWEKEQGHLILWVWHDYRWLMKDTAYIKALRQTIARKDTAYGSLHSQSVAYETFMIIFLILLVISAAVNVARREAL